MRKLLFSVTMLGLVGCTATGLSPEDEARQLVEASGYTEVVITGYKPFACSKSDTYKTGFEATGPTGRKVAGVVCSEQFKGATMRITGFPKK